MDSANKRICRAHPMHMVLLADDSASMSGRPAANVTRGIRMWLTELLAAAGGGTKSYFYFSLIVFGTQARVEVSAMNLTNIDPDAISVEGRSGSTNMARALSVAREVLLADGSTPAYCSPFVFLYTDGRADDAVAARKEAAGLKATSLPCGRPTLVTLGFGDTDDDLLRAVASSSELYKKTQDSAELALLLPSIGTPTGRAGQSVDAFRRRIERAAPDGSDQVL